MPKKDEKEGSEDNQHKKPVHVSIQQQILENLVQLQRVHTNLAEKFDSLSSQLSELLNLFATAAKSFSENPLLQVGEKDKEFLDKVDKLLEQNKTIAKGLTLMEERMREKMYGGLPPQPRNQPPQQMTPSLQPAKNDDDDIPITPAGRPLPKF